MTMKHIFKIMMVTCLVGTLLTSCEQYLEVPSDASLTEEVIFSSYNTFQGYLDPCYSMVVDPNHSGILVSNNIGTESVNTNGASSAYNALNMNYGFLSQNGGRSIWIGYYDANLTPQIDRSGLYNFWPIASRICNIALKNLNYLTNATPEQKAQLEGQALFFRAYFNYEICRAFGSIPYLDKIYDETNLNQPRYWTDEVSGKKDCQAVFEKAARDLERAATLLPLSWESFNTGRVTKGAALSLLSKVLLHAGSPLFDEAATLGNSRITTENTEFNKAYMERAAKAAAQVIKLNLYSLTPFYGDPTEEAKSPGGGYRKIFCVIDGTVPYTSEIIFKRWAMHRTINGVGGNDQVGFALYNNWFSRIYAKHATLGQNAGGCDIPTLNFMDKFEMKDGTAYKPGNTINGGYDDDITKFQTNRDPRFDYNYRLHKEKIGVYAPNFENQGKTEDPTVAGPFLITKFWYPLVDKPNAQWLKFNYGTPILRYAEILLIYAEATFEATGDPDASFEGVMTARQALNLVRNRATMPDYNPATYAVARSSQGELSGDHPFRMAVRNERAVEVAYEGHLWFDYRRWKRTHVLDKKIWILDFKTDAATKSTFTSANRVSNQNYLVETRNYWLPFFVSQTQIYEGFPQNPGW